MFAPALPGFPTTQHQPRPRMRLSLKESRMKLLNATYLDRKSGIRGPKMMGEALRQPVVPDATLVISERSAVERPLIGWNNNRWRGGEPRSDSYPARLARLLTL